jgi:hypothetical protein
VAFRVVIAALVLVVSGLFVGPFLGRAMAAGEKERARDLFVKGAEAVEAGRPAEGLPLLLEAEALFHAPTHLLYIARAQAETGKLLDARSTYEKLANEKLPPRASKPFQEAQATAKSELPKITTRIPKLVVYVEPAASGLDVTLDGAALARALGEPIEIDPGPHTVIAKAPGYLDANVTVTAPEARETVVRVKLSPATKTSASPPVMTEPEEPGPDGMRIASITLMAVGGAGLAAGGALGIVSLLNTSEANDKFETCGLPCKPEIDDLDGQAATLGTASIIGLAAGGAVFGTGLILFFVGDSGSPDPAQSGSARMIAGPGYAGVAGSW